MFCSLWTSSAPELVYFFIYTQSPIVWWRPWQKAEWDGAPRDHHLSGGLLAVLLKQIANFQVRGGPFALLSKMKDRPVLTLAYLSFLLLINGWVHTAFLPGKRVFLCLFNCFPQNFIFYFPIKSVWIGLTEAKVTRERKQTESIVRKNVFPMGGNKEKNIY